MNKFRGARWDHFLAGRNVDFLCFLVLGTLAALALPSSARAEASFFYRIPAAQEEKILGLLAPKKLDDELIGGWVLDEAKIQEASVIFTVIQGSAKAEFTVKPPEEKGKAFSTLSFQVDASFTSVPSETQQPLSDAFKALLSQNDKGNWWAGYKQTPTATPKPLPTKEVTQGGGPDETTGVVPAQGMPLYILLAPILISIFLIIVFLPKILKAPPEEPMADKNPFELPADKSGDSSRKPPSSDDDFDEPSDDSSPPSA